MTNLPLGNRLAASGSRGFSLVEVCISLGIISFAAIPLLGLLAGGMGQLRGNMDRNQAINISQQIALEARQMDFYTLENKGTYSEYFTEEGDNVAAGNSQIVYTATVTVINPQANSKPLQASTAPATPTLVALAIKIRKTPGGVDNPANPSLATSANMVSCNDLSTLTTAP